MTAGRGLQAAQAPGSRASTFDSMCAPKALYVGLRFLVRPPGCCLRRQGRHTSRPAGAPGRALCGPTGSRSRAVAVGWAVSAAAAWSCRPQGSASLCGAGHGGHPLPILLRPDAAAGAPTGPEVAQADKGRPEVGGADPGHCQGFRRGVRLARWRRGRRGIWLSLESAGRAWRQPGRPVLDQPGGRGVRRGVLFSVSLIEPTAAADRGPLRSVLNAASALAPGS